MITAEEARKLSGSPIDDHVNHAAECIRQAATLGHREVALHDSFWVNEGYSHTKQWNIACQKLRDLGFTVEFYYKELQFVDMYTKVSW